MRKINMKLAGYGVIILNAFVVIVELLVIIKVLPYNIIGGGRLADYPSAVVMALFSIAVIVFSACVVLAAIGVIKTKRFKVFIKVWLWIYFAYTLLNIFTNLMGVTLFERVVMSIVCAVQAVFLLRLAIEKRKAS